MSFGFGGAKEEMTATNENHKADTALRKHGIVDYKPYRINKFF